ncbi:Tudor domain containing protein [Tritrichomonas foetus]|uniref:Tudor domain containing protein n=1 Tax=Tritrichomonas foetus TaxID=1144522 RepID=A0A1J4J5B5_9EUKA|nr:Tudor domain containing protein [Tritrichomonas foetus]|eukprot:OHS93335.1 Tudor domain containing protein [Tritrichomonas foetus]
MTIYQLNELKTKSFPLSIIEYVITVWKGLSMTNTQYRGIVDGILSGDSLIIRFLPPCPTPIQIIILEYLVAPKIGLPDGKIQDEPHGYDSWNYLRKLCIGKRVLISSHFKNTPKTRFHPAFGNLPISFTRVYLYDEHENPDIGLLAAKAGWVKLRDSTSNQNDKYLASLKSAEEAARTAKLGIWASGQGMVRHLPVEYSDEEVLSQREFKAIVKGVNNGTTLSLFLLPKQIQVQVQLAGCRPFAASRKDGSQNNNQYGTDAKQRAVRTFLHREIDIRICQKSDTNQNQNQNISLKSERTYIGCLLGAPDHAIVRLISDGLATFYPKTADFAPSADLYIRAEAEAKAEKRNIWSIAPQQAEKELKEFSGICTSVRSSSSLFITNGDERQLFYLASVKVPYFFYNGGGGGADPLGFEAREFLRANYLGKPLRAVPTGYASNRDYATIYCGQKCINEELVAAGFAVYSEPFIGVPSECVDRIKAAEESAKAKQIGLFAPVQPQPFKIIDISQFAFKREAQKYLPELQNETVNAIIEHIASGSKFHVIIPSKNLFIRTGLNGLLPSITSDKFGNEARLFCQQNFMQCNAEITINEIDKSGCFLSSIIVQAHSGANVSIASELIKRGLAEIHTRLLKTGVADPELLELQKKAAAQGLGVWSDKTRHSRELAFDKIEKVKVSSIWTPITFAVQFLGDEIHKIETVLANEPLTPLTSEDIKQLHRNDCIVARYNNTCYRARIENFDETNTKITEVKFIDIATDNKEFNEVYQLPESLQQIEPQAKTVKLGCLELVDSDQNEANIKSIWEMCTDAILYMHLMYDDESSNVLLTDQPSVDSGSLNAVLISNGIARFADHEVPPNIQNVLNNLKELQPESQSPESE